MIANGTLPRDEKCTLDLAIQWEDYVKHVHHTRTPLLLFKACKPTRTSYSVPVEVCLIGYMIGGSMSGCHTAVCLK